MTLPRRRRAAHRLAPLVPAVIGLFPVLLVTAISLANVRRPGVNRGDYALIELATRSAAHGEALLGPYSRFGWNHPGPAVFYWFAPWYEAFGQHPQSLGLAAAVLNAVAFGTTVLVAWRASGRAAAWAAAAWLVLVIVVCGSSWIDRIWNPLLVLAPMVAAAFAAAGVLAGRRWLLVLLTGVATFALQSHVGTVPVVGAIVAATVLQIAWGARRDLQGAWIRWRMPGAAAAALGALLWAPPIIEQLRGRPGNLGQLVQFVRAERGHHGIGEVLDKAAIQLTFAKVGLISNVVSVRRPLPGATGGRLAFLALLLAGVAVCWYLNRRMGRAFEQHLCSTALVVATAVVLGISRVVGPLEGYLTLPATAAGALLWAAIILTAAGAASSWVPARQRSRALGVVAVVVTGLSLRCCVLVWHSDPAAHLQVPARPDGRSVALADRLAREVPSGAIVRLELMSDVQFSYAALIANQIELEGGEVRVEPRFDYFFGRERQLDGCEELAVRLGRPGAEPDLRAGRVIDRVDGQSVQVRDLPRGPDCPNG